MVSAYFCFTASSSAVEQAFSQLDRCHLQKGRRRVGHQTFRRSLQVLSFKGDEQELEVHHQGCLFAVFLQAENGAAKVSNKGDRFVSTKGSWVRKKMFLQKLHGCARGSNHCKELCAMPIHQLGAPRLKTTICPRKSKKLANGWPKHP